MADIKYIIGISIVSVLMLWAGGVFADVPNWVLNTQVRQHNGVVYVRINVAGIATGCFTNITEKIVALPDRWQTLAELSANPVPATAIDAQVCNDTLPETLWIVAPNPSATDIPPTRPLKDDLYLNRWRIRTGLPCASETVRAYTNTSEYHYAVNDAGQRGITVCVKK